MRTRVERKPKSTKGIEAGTGFREQPVLAGVCSAAGVASSARSRAKAKSESELFKRVEPAITTLPSA